MFLAPRITSVVLMLAAGASAGAASSLARSGEHGNAPPEFAEAIASLKDAEASEVGARSVLAVPLSRRLLRSTLVRFEHDLTNARTLLQEAQKILATVDEQAARHATVEIKAAERQDELADQFMGGLLGTPPVPGTSYLELSSTDEQSMERARTALSKAGKAKTVAIVDLSTPENVNTAGRAGSCKIGSGPPKNDGITGTGSVDGSIVGGLLLLHCSTLVDTVLITAPGHTFGKISAGVESPPVQAAKTCSASGHTITCKLDLVFEKQAIDAAGGKCSFSCYSVTPGWVFGSSDPDAKTSSCGIEYEISARYEGKTVLPTTIATSPPKTSSGCSPVTGGG